MFDSDITFEIILITLLFFARYDVEETGDYEICLDNSFSILSSKTVYFEVSVDIQSEQFRIEMMNDAKSMGQNDTIAKLRVCFLLFLYETLFIIFSLLLFSH